MATFLLPVTLAEELERMMNSFWWSNKSNGARSINWMSWDRLCTLKENGGLGFRKLHLFNIAMLGRIGWRLYADPDALVCKVLKAKYFPRGNFLEAAIGHNPSYTWSSIWSTQDLLRSGMRWRIGDGERVKVFKDPWIRRDGRFFIQASYIDSELNNMRVSQLIKPNLRVWDAELISLLMNEEDAIEILSIHISPITEADKLVWHYTKNGVYSVFSAYKLACSLTINGDNVAHGSWRNLWKLKVPAKVKHFLWRCARDCLPTKTNLLGKGVQVSPGCAICGGGLENAWHVFVACRFADNCWSRSEHGQAMRMGAERSESFVELLDVILNLQNEEDRANISMLIWQLWKDRNLAAWESKQPHPQRTIAVAKCSRNEWLAMQGKRMERGRRRGDAERCRGWHDLDPGWFHCGVDAAFFTNLNAAGTGIIVRDERGSFVAAKVCRFQGCFRVDEGEAMSIYEALSWIKQRGLSRVVIESDSKTVCDAINARLEDNSELGSIVKSCYRILEENVNFVVKFVKHDANELAHIIARLSKDFSVAHIWDEPPNHVEGLLHVPCVCSE